MIERSLTQWRAFVGPRLKPIDKANPTDPLTYEWNNFTLGTTDDTFGQGFTTTTAAVDLAADTVIPVADTNPLPAWGSVWMGPSPSGASEAWRIIYYSALGAGNLQLIGYENPVAPLTYFTGAVIREWFPIETDEPSLTWDRSMDNDLLRSTWAASFRVIDAPRLILAEGHIVLVQHRSRTTVTPWAAWSTLFSGVIKEVSAMDGLDRYNRRSVALIPFSEYLASQIDVPSIRAGEFNVAKNSTVTTSTVLAAAHKENVSGDFAEAAPVLSGSSVIDDEMGSLWIGEQFLGGSNPPQQATGQSDFQITQMYFNPALGQGRGFQWIELTLLAGVAPAFRIYVNNGTDPVVWGTYASQNQISVGDHIILADNAALFNAENPGHGAAAVLDARADLVPEGGVIPFTFIGANPTGGALSLVNADTAFNIQNILFGDGAFPVSDPNFQQGFTWQGPAMPAAQRGEYYRMIYTTTVPANNRDMWSVDRFGTPGYNLGDVPPAWIKLVLPGIRLKLKDSHLANQPAAGERLYIVDDSGRSTAGLPPSGAIQVGLDQIAYINGTIDSVEVVSHSNSEPHAAGDAVYFVNTVGVAVDALPIKQIELERPAGTNRPDEIEIYGSSALVEARDPSDTSFTADYDQVQALAVTMTADKFIYALSAAQQRLKTLLIRIVSMASVPSRPRLNELRAMVLRDSYDADRWTVDNQYQTLIQDLLWAMGYDAGALTVSGTPPVLSDRVTEQTSALTVIMSLCKSYAYTMIDNPDSTMTIAPSTVYLTTSFVAVRNWDRDNVIDIRQQDKRPLKLREVVVNWDSPTLDDQVTNWPATPNAFGKIHAQGPHTFTAASEALTLAERVHNLLTVGETYTVQCAGTVQDVQPGDIHTIDWQFDIDPFSILRTCVVTSVTNSLRRNDDAGGVVWGTTLTLRRVE